MARKPKAPPHEEHENAERWLLTYADMITLLMAFFIMMYAMSQVDKNKFSAMAASVREQLGSGMTPVLEGSLSLNPSSGSSVGITDGFTFMVEKMIQQEVAGSNTGKSVTVSETEDGVVVRIEVTSALFAPSSAEISTDMAGLLKRIAKALARVPNDIHVEGHTCDLPVRSGQYRDNWELSAARAVNVVLYFVRNCQLAPQRFLAAGLSDTHPLQPNTSEENRRGNRRIDIIVVKGRAAQQKAQNLSEGIAPSLGAIAR
jgi:chemotaxis protein MotB